MTPCLLYLQELITIIYFQRTPSGPELEGFVISEFDEAVMSKLFSISGQFNHCIFTGLDYRTSALIRSGGINTPVKDEWDLKTPPMPGLDLVFPVEPEPEIRVKVANPDCNAVCYLCAREVGAKVNLNVVSEPKICQNCVDGL